MTEHVIDVGVLPKDQQDIHNYLIETELSGRTADAYKLSHAGLGKSGYSVGHSQVDLSEHPKLADDIWELVDSITTISEADKETIKTALHNKEVNATVTANLSKINAALKTTAGYKAVDDIHKANLAVVAGRVQGVINAATPANRAFLSTKLGRALLADNVNQYGIPDYLSALVGGAEVELIGTKHKLDAPLGIKSYVDYVGGYFFSQMNPGDMERRMEATAKYFGVPQLAEAAQAKALELKPVSEALNLWFGDVHKGKTFSRKERNALAANIIERQRPITQAVRNGYELSRLSGFNHEAAMAHGDRQFDLARAVNERYAAALGTGLSQEDAVDIATGAMGKTGRRAFRTFSAAGFSFDAALRHGLGKVNVEALQKDIMAESAHWGLPVEQVRELAAARMDKADKIQTADSATLAAHETGLNKEQTLSLARNVGNKGADWWDAALASEADRLMHEAEARNFPEQTGNKKQHGDAGLPKGGIQLAMAGPIPAGFFGGADEPVAKPQGGVPTYGANGALQSLKEAEKRQGEREAARAKEARAREAEQRTRISNYQKGVDARVAQQSKEEAARWRAENAPAKPVADDKVTQVSHTGSDYLGSAGRKPRGANSHGFLKSSSEAKAPNRPAKASNPNGASNSGGAKREPYSNGKLGKDGGFTPDDPNRSVKGNPTGFERTLNSLFGNAPNWAGQGKYYSGGDGGDGPGEPDSSKDRSENGWSGMGQNEQWHDGGVVTNNDPVLNEVAINVTAQEGEFVLSRAALAMLGEDLMGRVNRALRTGDRDTITRLQQVLHSTLGAHAALPEADLKASMNERAYWDQNDPHHDAAHARVAREFRVAFPGHSDMDKAEHIGGMITDHDPDTYLDDYKIDIPEGAFVVSRTATRLAGLPALMRINALAEGSDAALAATLKRELEAALGIIRPAGEAELKAMMHDPRYTDAQHPEHIAYRQMIADGFRAAFPG